MLPLTHYENHATWKGTCGETPYTGLTYTSVARAAIPVAMQPFALVFAPQMGYTATTSAAAPTLSKVGRTMTGVAATKSQWTEHTLYVCVKQN
jgi:hypothetical protein